MPNRFVLFDLQTKKLIGVSKADLLAFLGITEGGGGPPGEGAVLYNVAQDLEPEEKGQALTNIGAAGTAALATVELGLAALADAIEDLPTSAEVVTAISNAVQGLASQSYVDTKLEDFVTETALTTALGDYVTSTNLTAALDSYVTKASLTTALGDYVTSTNLTAALDSYVTKASLTTTLGDYVTETELTTTLGDYATAAALATTDAKIGTSITTALADYATKTELATTDAKIGTSITTALSSFTYAADKLTGTALAATITDSSLTKLAGGTVGTAAFQNSTAFAAASHGHVAANISDFDAAVRGQVVSQLKAGANITLTPSGSGGSALLEIISAGSVSKVSVVSTNGFSGSVSNDTTTPAITLVANDITPTSVNAITFSKAGGGAASLQVTGAASVSGSNTGDQTNITGNAATAKTLQTARTINGTSFNGSANITITAAAGTLTGTSLNATVVTSSLTSVGILSGLSVGANRTGSLSDTTVTNYTKRTTTSGSSGVTLAAHDEYISAAFTNANVGVARLMDIIDNGSASGGAGHLVGAIGRAQDTATGNLQIVGVEGTITRRGGADTGAGVWGLSRYIGTTFTNRTINAIIGFCEVINGSAVAINQGTTVVFRAFNSTGGDPNSRYALLGDSGLKLATGGRISSISAANTGETNMDHDGSNGTVGTTVGRLQLAGAAGNYVPAGTGTGRARIGGLMSVNTTAVGNVGGGQDDLMTYTLPGNTLVAAGDTLKIRAAFQFATNGNTKTVALLLGSSVLYSLIAPISGGSAPIGFIILETVLTRKTATACISVTQINIGTDTVTQGAVAVIETVTETLSGNLVLKGLGESAASATNDVRQVFMMVELLPAP